MLLQQLFGLGFQVRGDRETGFRVQLQLHSHSAAVTESQQLHSHSSYTVTVLSIERHISRDRDRGTGSYGGTDTGIGQVIQRSLDSEGAVLHRHCGNQQLWCQQMHSTGEQPVRAAEQPVIRWS